MFTYNNKIYKSKKDLVIAIADRVGTQYPKNIVDLWTTTELNAIGVKVVVEQPKPDSFYYTDIVLQLDGSYTKTEKPLDEVKANKLKQINQQASSDYAKNDWYYSRLARNGKAVPQTIVDEGLALDNKVLALDISINSATSIEDLEVIKYESD